jgi:hypothetical protein
MATATATVSGGAPATFALTLTPLNNFVGNVALTCTPSGSVPYASCSLLSSTLTLNGLPLSSTATINTITSSAGMSVFGVFFVTGVAVFWCRRRRTFVLLFAVTVLAAGTALVGCGSGKPGSSNLHYTPAGTYPYTVTAASTTGQAVSSSVTLTLVVK